MILELASFLGTSVGGSLLGAVRDHFSNKRQEAREDREYGHQLDLAKREGFVEYLATLNQENAKGNYSPMQYVIALIVLILGVTYSLSTLSCFFWEPNSIVWTKDPSEDARQVSILFGSIKWDLANLRVISMSKAGLGYLQLYPIIFILSQVITGDVIRRR